MKTLYATAFVSLALFLLPAAAAVKDEVLLDVRIVGHSSGKPEPSSGPPPGNRRCNGCCSISPLHRVRRQKSILRPSKGLD